MSLIGDALRKTRQEAAERESERKGVLFSAKIANPPTRSNLGLGLALGAAIAIAATVAGGSAAWWLLGARDSDQDQPQHSAAATTTAAAIDPSPENSDRDKDRDSGSKQRPATAPGSATASPVTVDPDPVPDPDSISDSGGGSDRANHDSTTSRPQHPKPPSSDAGFIGVEDGADVYVLEANLGRVQLSLDFIIFRTDDPFAEINGIELHLGGVIEGYRVKAIERDRVHLSNGRKDIVLRTP